MSPNPPSAADVHTLFDLNLLGIEPKDLRVELHPDIVEMYGKIVRKTLSSPANRRPSRDALKRRYELLAKNATFERLETLAVQQNRPADHNRIIIGREYDEEGVLGRLLAAASSLRELTVPSAPGANFFQVGPRPLRFLSVDAGYATQSFIRNLALSTSLGSLTCFEWGEYNESYMDDFRSNCTPLEDYRSLFGSQVFSTVKHFVWRNPACSMDEIKALQQQRPDLQLLVVRSSAEYI